MISEEVNSAVFFADRLRGAEVEEAMDDEHDSGAGARGFDELSCKADGLRSIAPAARATCEAFVVVDDPTQ
jgi:hypothetical protein